MDACRDAGGRKGIESIQRTATRVRHGRGPPVGRTAWVESDRLRDEALSYQGHNMMQQMTRVCAAADDAIWPGTGRGLRGGGSRSKKETQAHAR